MEEIIIRYLENKASDKERKVLLDWIRNKNNFREFSEIKNDWSKELPQKRLNYNTEEGIVKFQSFMLKDLSEKNRKVIRLQNWYKYSAVLLLIFMIGTTFYLINGVFSNSLSTTVLADKGYVSSIVLPDSSKVWLNSGSSITYSNNFGMLTRNLTINGQAYFEVTKNKLIPFIVKSKNVDVKVLGTRFTIDAYDDAETASVILEEGSVEMSLEKFPDKKYFLNPGDRVTYDIRKQQLEKAIVKAERYSAWRNGMLNFYNSSLKDVFIKLNKRYNYNFFLDKSLEDIEVTFTINQESLAKVLELLKTITPINIESKGDSVLVKPYLN